MYAIAVRLFLGLSLIYAPLALADKSVTPGPFNRAFTTSLPIFHVHTNGQVINKTTEIPVKLSIQNGATNSSEDALRARPELTAKMQFRGNSSMQFSKKQYDLELTDPSNPDEKKALPLLGMAAHHKWVIAAPYTDRLLVRNAYAFALARSLQTSDGGMWWAPKTQPIELYINGRYHGVYTLTEKIDASKDRMALGKVNWDEPAKSMFIVKSEKTKSRDHSEYFHTADEKQKVTYYEPKPKDLVKKMEEKPRAAQAMLGHIQRTMNRAEAAILAIKKGDLKSYRNLIDVQSFQNFMLVQEVLKNLDGFRRSIYFHYKNGKLNLGPVWDFDLAMANITVFNQMRASGFQICHGFYIDLNPEQFWFENLMRDPAFRNSYIARYRELRKPGQALSTEALLGRFQAMTGQLAQAQSRNFTVWKPNGEFDDGPVMLFVPKYKDFNYAAHVKEIGTWLRWRLDWLDRNIQNICDNIDLAGPRTATDDLVLRPDVN